jgi:hypothetical protein
MTAIDYIPVGWSITKLASAPNMQHMEEMYPDLVSKIDLHVHPTIHYSKAQSDALFFGPGIETGLDAEYLDSLPLSSIMGGLAPNGLHLIWPGTDNDFLNGYLIQDSRWHLADGGVYNGIYTTDMRGYFTRSAISNSGSGTGGSATSAPSGTVSINGHSLSLAEIPAHYHTYGDQYYGGNWGTVYLPSGSFMNEPVDHGGYTSNAGSGTAHDHGSVSTNLSTIDILPSHVCYYFICKVST